jgi:hypothetical protein
MGIKYDLSFDNSKKLEEALKKSATNLEPKLNDYLHVKGSKEVMKSVIDFTPISNRNKAHAKTSSSLRTIGLNLAFEVTTKGKFGYLFFPDQGVGKHNLVAQEFFNKGLKSKEDKMFKDIMKVIEDQLKIQI